MFGSFIPANTVSEHRILHFIATTLWSPSYFHSIVSSSPLIFPGMASDNGENSILERDLDNDAEFSQNRGVNNGSDTIQSLSLYNSDHPGMILVTTSLTGSNYLIWSRLMKIALIAKQKVGFVTEKCITMVASRQHGNFLASQLNFQRFSGCISLYKYC